MAVAAAELAEFGLLPRSGGVGVGVGSCVVAEYADAGVDMLTLLFLPLLALLVLADGGATLPMLLL